MVSAEPVEAEAETAITDALPTEAEAASGVNKNYGEAQLVSVANDSGTRFFEQARLKREKAHDEAMDTLQKSLKSSSLTAEENKEYTVPTETSVTPDVSPDTCTGTSESVVEPSPSWP